MSTTQTTEAPTAPQAYGPGARVEHVDSGETGTVDHASRIMPGSIEVRWDHGKSTTVDPEWVRPAFPKVGDFLAYTMVTDTRVYEVVNVTAATITVRAAADGERSWSENIDGNPWPVTSTEQVAAESAPVMRLRYRKDGTFRTHRTSRPLRPCPTVDGVPVRFTDYRF